jgi:quercetin dioxygenase-like cupin family protein
MRFKLLLIGTGAFVLGCDAAQTPGVDPLSHYAATQMVATRPSELSWGDLGLVPGVQITVLSGDPSKAEHYVLRLKFPPNTRMPAHWHPQAEYATILSGTLMLGMGTEEKPEGLQPYSPGSFLVVPPRMSHYGMSTDEVIFELSGPGPYEVVFANDADDPRKR